VRAPEFERLFAEEWRPDLCLMAISFGQIIPPSIFEMPRLGFFNFHQSDEVWPSYHGPDPIAGMVRDGKTHVVITMHKVNARGEVAVYSLAQYFSMIGLKRLEPKE
jgi:methionyl-tRNA formyltransferase